MSGYPGLISDHRSFSQEQTSRKGVNNVRPPSSVLYRGMYALWIFGMFGIVASFMWGVVAETYHPTYRALPQLYGFFLSIVVIIGGFVVRQRLVQRSFKIQPGLSDEEAHTLRSLGVIVFGIKKTRFYLALPDHWQLKPFKSDLGYLSYDPATWQPRYGRSFYVSGSRGEMLAEVQLIGETYRIAVKLRFSINIRWTTVGFVYDVIDHFPYTDKTVYTTVEHVYTPDDSSEDYFDTQCRSAHLEVLRWAAERRIRWNSSDWSLPHPLVHNAERM